MGRRASDAGAASRRIALDDDPDALSRAVRILGASINVRILGILSEARRSEPAGGWMFLSSIAERLNEAPGSVGLAIEKLRPFVEEKREKGRRWFRSRVQGVTMVLDELEPVGPL
ncbi:MAG: hypothetical protein ACYDDF_08575 [Thermoplasmatota archaeon]